LRSDPSDVCALLERLPVAIAWIGTYGKLIRKLAYIPEVTIAQIDLTRNYISCIHRIIILDEAKAIHKLDLGDVTRTILEMALNVFLGHCRTD